MDNLSIGGPTEIGRSTRLTVTRKIPTRSRPEIVIVVKQLTRNKETAGFRLWTRNYGYSSNQNSSSH
ncbi:unnamed protein product [Staurois parvus]|uniref:Uncharacterized protein n=1 Tax=Staurois parvus TaxID=386267 RepID=A0ABN9F1L8_9NEOB|nr:unnamed protein product [Staurois parvus]